MSSSKRKKPAPASVAIQIEAPTPTASIVKIIEEAPISPIRKKNKGTYAVEKGANVVMAKESILKPPNDQGAKKFLAQHNWPVGLQDALVKSCKKIAVRYVITDDSGSMMTNDGHRLIGVGTKNAKMIQCTRWSELTNSLKFHAQLAHAAQAPTEFRLLNHCDPIMVGLAEDTEGKALEEALTVSLSWFYDFLFFPRYVFFMCMMLTLACFSRSLRRSLLPGRPLCATTSAR